MADGWAHERLLFRGNFQDAEILEQHYPILFEEYALRGGSGGAGRHRGGFGINYRVRMLRGEGKASFLMDHGRTGPPGLIGGGAGATNEIEISQEERRARPEHLSKGEGYVLRPGDWIQVRTPGGGGYGAPAERDPAMIERDVRRGYFTRAEAAPVGTSGVAGGAAPSLLGNTGG